MDKQFFFLLFLALAAYGQYIGFKDGRDGKVYIMVKIGKQTWMAQNLNYEAEGSFCFGGGEGGRVNNRKTRNWDIVLSNAEIQANCNKYGRLYNWFAAMEVCPNGWHLPSMAEWDELTETVGGFSTAVKKLKATNGWVDYDRGEPDNGDDAYGFSALPGGYAMPYVYNGPEVDFSGVSYGGHWWSASEHPKDYGYYGLYYDLDIKNSFPFYFKNSLKSVRCVKDAYYRVNCLDCDSQENVWWKVQNPYHDERRLADEIAKALRPIRCYNPGK